MKKLMMFLLVPMMTAPAQEKKEDTYARKIQPILTEHCYKCHGDERVRNRFDVSTKEQVLKGGEHGPAVVPGKPEQSLLIRTMRYEGEFHMPPRGKLDEKTIAEVADWIRSGAK